MQQRILVEGTDSVARKKFLYEEVISKRWHEVWHYKKFFVSLPAHFLIIENDLFIEDVDLREFFQPYLFPNFEGNRLQFIPLFSSYVSLTTLELCLLPNYFPFSSEESIRIMHGLISCRKAHTVESAFYAAATIIIITGEFGSCGTVPVGTSAGRKTFICWCLKTKWTVTLDRTVPRKNKQNILNSASG